MLAVSGSHITYIISAFSIFMGKKNKRTTQIITIFFLIFFMALTQFTASVVRASIMGILIITAGLVHRKSDTINNLGIASLIILICNPYTIIDAGFWLSFAGTIGIILLEEPINNYFQKFKVCKIKPINWIINSFTITLSANIIIIPIMAYMFSTFSITFWISNILAAPIMEFTTIYGFIIYFISIFILPIAQFLGMILNFFLKLLIKIAEITSLIPGSTIYIKTPYLFECMIYYIIVIALLKRKKIRCGILKIRKKLLSKRMDNSKEKQVRKNYLIEKKKKIYRRNIAIVLIMIILLNIVTKQIFLETKIYFIDVGQGDSTLIQTIEGKNILIDGGGSEFGNFDVGESILLPYLLDRRITAIDYLMISHFDSDHIGGIFSIIEHLKVKNIIISKQGENSENLKKFYEIVKEKNAKILIVKKGDVIKIDKYSYFEILFPEDNLIKENVLNNNSIVARFNSLDFSMLFTGDIEEIAEKRLCELYSGTDKLEALVLKVAHHGSKTSSTNEFLEMVKPKLALVGVGKNNNFGHPNEGVIERLENMSCKIYRTDNCGEIEIKINKRELQIHTKIK